MSQLDALGACGISVMCVLGREDHPKLTVESKAEHPAACSYVFTTLNGQCIYFVGKDKHLYDDKEEEFRERTD